MKTVFLFGLSLCGALFAFLPCQAVSWDLSSPEGELKVRLCQEQQKARFHVQYQGEEIMRDSAIGLMLDGCDLTQGVTITQQSERQCDEMWQTVNGKAPRVRNFYQEYTFHIQGDKVAFLFIMRLYKDGFAYRYQFPQAVSSWSEKTHLSFCEDYTLRAYNGENHTIGPLKRSATPRGSFRIPLVLELAPKKVMAIHEAAILSTAPFSLYASPDDLGLRFHSSYTAREAGFTSSWRCFILGERAGDLVESNLLVNLNEPCKIEDTSWIKPGKSMWDWRVWGYTAPDGFQYQLDTLSHKRLIDFAARNNIQNLLIDADWYGPEFDKNSDPSVAREGIDIEECMAYAKSKKIGIILYLNDVGAKKYGLERCLKQFSQWGAIGVKYGFMKGTPEEKVQHTRRVVELCAQYKLMVDFHDNPIPPSGDERTWPNLVTREFVHAQADAKKSYYPETAVNAVLINQIAGPIDMTNGWFDLNQSVTRPKVFQVIPGTLAAELAKLVAIHTGWMVLPDAPESYLRYPEMFEAIQQMPAQFDSLQILDAQFDTYVSVLRQAGKDYWVGSLTNRSPRDIRIPLTFLEPHKRYKATLYEDAPNTHFETNKETYQVKELEVTAESTIHARLAPGGGHCIWLRELPE